MSSKDTPAKELRATSMRNREYYTKNRLVCLSIFIGLTIIHFISLYNSNNPVFPIINSSFSDHGILLVPSAGAFLSFLADWNPIATFTNYRKRHPIVSEGKIIHLCLEQYGEIRPYFVRDIVINRGYVENYNTKCHDYISLTPITLENAGLFVKGKNLTDISSTKEARK